MSDATEKLIEMERRIDELSAEVGNLRTQLSGRRARVATGGTRAALLLAVALATVPLATGAHNRSLAEGISAHERHSTESLQPVQVDALELRVRTLEQKFSQPLTVRAPFTVVDASGGTVLKAEVFNNAPRMSVGNPAAGGAWIGVGASGAGYVIVRGAAGREGVSIGQREGSGMGVQVLSADSQAVEARLGVNAANKGELAIGDLKSGGVHVGVGEKSGSGFMMVRRADSRDGIAIGQYEGRPMSVGVFGDNDKELVSLRTDSKGGTVRVMNASGVSVGGLLASETGGGLALTGPSGGKSAISLAVESSGGKVRVYPAAGGSTHAELTAETSGGAMALYTSAGAASALLQTGDGGAGRLELSRSGTIFVEAGVAGGRGIVRAGPTTGGPPMGALGFADTIMGKIK